MLMLLHKNLIKRITIAACVVFSSTIWAAKSPEFDAAVSDCNSGLTQQCINVGVAYKNGKYKTQKVPQDKAKAKMFISQAVKQGQTNCKQGDNLDCYTLGLLFFEGAGIVPTDIPRGLEFLQRSCRGGYAQACAWLDNSGLGRGR